MLIDESFVDVERIYYKKYRKSDVIRNLLLETKENSSLSVSAFIRLPKTHTSWFYRVVGETSAISSKHRSLIKYAEMITVLIFI